MKAKREGHTVDRMAKEKRENTERLMAKMPQILTSRSVGYCFSFRTSLIKSVHCRARVRLHTLDVARPSKSGKPCWLGVALFINEKV
ncbi:hypothetical protein ACFX2F_002049 [Malus domestica]